MFALITAFFVDDIASTVLVAVNKIGSLINGPYPRCFFAGLTDTQGYWSGGTGWIRRRVVSQCGSLGGSAIRIVAVVECHWTGGHHGRGLDI